ncbi:hypothetical protein SBADM41S_11861 [Streptomyces badius]
MAQPLARARRLRRRLFDGVFSPWIPGGTGTSNGRGALLIARDEGMEASWDTTGYTLDEHGDGPPASSTKRRAGDRSRLDLRRDPYDRAGFPYEPYLTSRSNFR